MTQTVWLEAVDVTSDFPTLGGSSTPTTINLGPVDMLTDFRGGGSPAYAGPGVVLAANAPEVLAQAPQITIQVFDMNGAPVGTLTDDSTLVERRWELNGLGGATWVAPLQQPDLVALFDAQGKLRPDRTVGFYADGNWLGQVIPMPRVNPRTVDSEGAGFAYHLARRFVGRNNATPNLVSNGSFDEDITPWVENGSVDSAWVSSPYHSQPGAMLVAASTAGDNYMSRTVTVESFPYETFVWFEAWAYVVSTLGDDELPGDELGIKVFGSIAGVNVFVDGEPIDWKRPGTWQRVVLKVYIPNDATMRQFDFRLYAPEGQVVWDDVYVWQEERLYATGGPETVMTALVVHAQDESIGKKNVGITVDTSNSSGAVAVSRGYKYVERANISQAINELVQLTGSVDWHMEEPAPNQRIFTTFPRTGFDTGNKQDLRWGYNVSDWSFVPDVSRYAEVVALMGRGSGDMRNEAFAVVDPLLVGYENVSFTTIEASIATQAGADGILETSRNPRVIRLTCHRALPFFTPSTLFAAGDLLPGRLVHVEIDDGVVVLDEDCKVVAATYRPEVELAVLDVVPVSEIL